MYEISIDMHNRIIYDRLVGYWDAATAERFCEEFRAAIQKVAANGPGWKILANHSEFETQSPEVAAMLLKTASYAEANGLAKAAVYTPGALKRLQIKRMGTIDKFGPMRRKMKHAPGLTNEMIIRRHARRARRRVASPL